MLSSDHHKFVTESLEDALGLSVCNVIPESTQYQQATINTTAILFNHIPACFMALHLVYEVFSLNDYLQGLFSNHKNDINYFTQK
jgi:hypothetical protein